MNNEFLKLIYDYCKPLEGKYIKFAHYRDPLRLISIGKKRIHIRSEETNEGAYITLSEIALAFAKGHDILSPAQTAKCMLTGNQEELLDI